MIVEPLGAETPDVAGPDSAIGPEAAYDSDVDAAFYGDDAVTPGPLEDLDDSVIADTVGPGVLDEPLGGWAAASEAREASRNAAGNWDTNLRGSARGEGLVDPESAALGADINRLDAAEHALVNSENREDEWGLEPTGDYYGDLLTGQVEDGPLTSEDRRIGPFPTAAAARAALADARADYGGRPLDLS